MSFKLDEYHKYSQKLLITAALTGMLSVSVASMVNLMVSFFIPSSAGLFITAGIGIVVATIGLYLINKNGKEGDSK